MRTICLLVELNALDNDTCRSTMCGSCQYGYSAGALLSHYIEMAVLFMYELQFIIDSGKYADRR